MCQWIGSALAQIMTFRLFGAKSSSKPMLLSIGPLGTNLSETWIEIQNFSLRREVIWNEDDDGSQAVHTVYPKKYAHGFCFAVLCCGYCSGSLEPEYSCHDRDWIMELPMEADILTFTGILTPEDASVASCFPFDITISLSWFPLLSIPPLHSAIP